MITPTFQDYDNEVVLLPGTVKMYVGKIVKFVELVERKWEQHSPSLKLPSTLQSRNSNLSKLGRFREPIQSAYGTHDRQKAASSAIIRLRQTGFVVDYTTELQTFAAQLSPDTVEGQNADTNTATVVSVSEIDKWSKPRIMTFEQVPVSCTKSLLCVLRRPCETSWSKESRLLQNLTLEATGGRLRERPVMIAA